MDEPARRAAPPQVTVDLNRLEFRGAMRAEGVITGPLVRMVRCDRWVQRAVDEWTVADRRQRSVVPLIVVVAHAGKSGTAPDDVEPLPIDPARPLD